MEDLELAPSYENAAEYTETWSEAEEVFAALLPRAREGG
jgi:hypothetical protein